MKAHFSLFFILLLSLSAFSQKKDTVIKICTFDNPCKVEDFHFKEPTVLIIRYFQRKQLHHESGYTFMNGKLNGPYWSINSSSSRDTGNYENGLREGIFKGWYSDNGKVSAVLNYSEGKINGIKKEYSWGKNHAYRTSLYIDGKKNGKEITYFDEGKKGIEKTYINDTVADTIYWYDSTGEKIRIAYDCKRYDGGWCTEVYLKPFQENFGIGRLSSFGYFYPQGDEKTEAWKAKRQKIIEQYYLYEHPKDKEPAKHSNGSSLSLATITIGDPLNYNDLSSIILKEEKGWTQLLLNVDNTGYDLKDRRKLWIKTEMRGFEFLPWEKYLIEHPDCRIIDLKSNPILKSPIEDSERASCQISECLIIKEIKGDWARVSVGFGDCVHSKNRDCAGWIRWRNKNQFLIY